MYFASYCSYSSRFSPIFSLFFVFVTGYCDYCRNETWVDWKKACAAAGCEKLAVVGPWTLVDTKRIDRAAYNKGLLRNRKRGVVLAKEASEHVLNDEGIGLIESGERSGEFDLDKDSLREGEDLVVIRFEVGEEGFAYRLARLTEPHRRAQEAFQNKGDKKTASKFRKGDDIVCIQYLERTPVDSPSNFELGREVTGDMDELYVNVQALRKVDIKVSDVMTGRRTRGKKITKITLTPKMIEEIHKEISEFEAAEERGRWA